MGVLTTITLIFILLLGNAFFVAAEFALISSRRDRIENLIAVGKPGARRVLTAISHLSINLAACQLGITICSLILGKVAEPAIASFIEIPFHELGIPDQLLHPLSFVIALGVITFLHILLGEMVPKNISLAGPETLAIWLTPLLLFWAQISRPLISLMNAVARGTLKLMGIEQRDELDSTVDEDQLKTMITESRSEGLLDAEEHARLHKALRNGRTLAEVMIPLDKVRTVHYGRRGPLLKEVEQAVLETGFSRFPVATNDHVFQGYVHVKDVLDRFDGSGTYPADAIIHRGEIRLLTTIDIGETVDQALHELHHKSAHMAQVRDRGRLVGVVTLEDLIEEYLGTFNDWTHGQ